MLEIMQSLTEWAVSHESESMTCMLVLVVIIVSCMIFGKTK